MYLDVALFYGIAILLNISETCISIDHVTHCMPTAIDVIPYSTKYSIKLSWFHTV